MRVQQLVTWPLRYIISSSNGWNGRERERERGREVRGSVEGERACVCVCVLVLLWWSEISTEIKREYWW